MEMKKIFPLFCLLAFPLLANAETDAEITSLLQQVARKVNATLPMRMAEATVMGVTAGPGKQITYYSTSDFLKSQWTPAMFTRAKNYGINSYCTSPGMEPFRSYGVTVVYDSTDTNGVHLFRTTVSPQDCR